MCFLPWYCAGRRVHGQVGYCLQGWPGLQQELAVDMQRLWQRNLGRDDRLVADTSRCAAAVCLDMLLPLVL